MTIKFDKVTPYPLDGVTHLNTELWDKELFFESSKKYKINAPSGKGKSTFIHLIYGLRNDYKGTIFIEEKNVKHYNNNDWAALRHVQRRQHRSRRSGVEKEQERAHRLDAGSRVAHL